jgi:peroxiredoxin
MTIKVGDRLPETSFTTMGAKGPEPRTTSQVFAGRKAVLFAVPGAYTPTCSEQHLPGFVDKANAIAEKGVTVIACTAVNDIFVLDAWAKARSADGKVLMLADGNAEFARKIGLEIDLSGFGLGTRSKRYAMVVDDLVVTYLAVEDSPPQHEKATADKLLQAL